MHRLKLQRKTTGKSGYHSANAAQEIEMQMDEKMVSNLSPMAIAAEETIQQLVDEATKKQNTTKPDESDPDIKQLLQQVVADQKTIEARITKLEDKKGTEEPRNHECRRKYCKNCGRHHYAPEEACLNLPKNAEKRPKNFVVSFGYKKKDE